MIFNIVVALIIFTLLPVALYVLGIALLWLFVSMLKIVTFVCQVITWDFSDAKKPEGGIHHA